MVAKLQPATIEIQIVLGRISQKGETTEAGVNIAPERGLLL